MTTTTDTDVLAGARELIRAGVPVFIARPALDDDGQWNPTGGTGGTGYWLPRGWEHTRPDELILDRWRPGWAVAAVMGHGIDLLDIDPRSGGAQSLDELDAGGLVPRAYARAATPSGGEHLFVASLDVRSRDAVRPGLDIKAGTRRPGADGKHGYGFAFIAPTVKLSKTTGELVAYSWTVEPDAETITLEAHDDDTGAVLAEMVRAAHGSNGTGSTSQTPFSGPTGSPWDDVPGLLAQGRHKAVHALASALRGRGGWRVEDAVEYMRAVVWPHVDQDQGGHPYDWAEFEADVRDVFDRYDDGQERRDAEGEQEAQDDYQLLVADEARKLRVRRDAQDLLRTEEVADQPPPPAITGAEFLAQPDHADHLVDGLIPRRGKFLIAAAAKAGKTTTVHYTAKALLDGSTLFGKFPVNITRPLTVHLLDNEMGDDMLRAWLRRLGLTNEQLERLTVHSMLGYASTFDPTNRASRRLWARRLAGADVVLIDCLSPFLQAVGLDENRDAGRWLVGLDELMAAAGVAVYGVAHHTGHDGERARGDSKILGWPFQTWTLNREATDKDDDDADDAPRFIKARGRCGSIPSGQLVLTGEGLTYMGGTSRAKVRAEAAAERLLRDILAAAAEEVGPGVPFGVGKASEWVGRDAKTVRPALLRGVGNGVLAKTPNPSGSGSVFSLVTGGGE